MKLGVEHLTLTPGGVLLEVNNRWDVSVYPCCDWETSRHHIPRVMTQLMLVILKDLWPKLAMLDVSNLPSEEVGGSQKNNSFGETLCQDAYL